MSNYKYEPKDRIRLNVEFEPTIFDDIFLSVHEIQVQRDEFDLGTMTVTLLDADLDPANGGPLRPNLRIELLMIDTLSDDGSGTWQQVFTGTVQEINTTYDIDRLNADNPRHARITMTCVDNMKVIAGLTHRAGVNTVDELRWVLRKDGDYPLMVVPADLDGETTALSSATVTSTNDNASIADQVALTRDSVLGAAWFDRKGTLKVRTTLPTFDSSHPPFNGTFDQGTTGWQPDLNSEMARVTNPTHSGEGALRFGRSGVGGTRNAHTPTGTAGFPVEAGEDYPASMWCMLASGANRTASLNIDFYNASGVFISTVTASATANNSTWTEIADDFTAPTGAAYASVRARVASASAGQYLVIDDLTFNGLVSEEIYEMGEDVYSDIDLSFDTGRLINSINFRVLSYNSGTDETTEDTSVTYTDDTSIATWGVHHHQFTISFSAIIDYGISNYTDAVFAANATPVMSPKEVQVPLVTDEQRVTSALVDLYDIAHVVNTDKDVDVYLRVTSVRHQITQDGWLMHLGFAQDATYALPTRQP